MSILCISVDPSQLVIPRQQFHFCCCMQQSKNSCWCMQENIEATYTTIVTLVEPSQPITHVSSVLTCHSHQQCHTTLENSLNTSSVTNETVTLLVLDVKKYSNDLEIWPTASLPLQTDLHPTSEWPHQQVVPPASKTSPWP